MSPSLIGYEMDEDLNYEVIMVVDPESGDTFSIQRALQFDEQDIVSGMDTYCLTRGAASHYGGIESWSLSESSFQVTLNLDAARALELPSSLELEVSGSKLDDIRSHLRRMVPLS